MSHVQQLLAKAEADFNKRCAGIKHHAASIEALGEVLSDAYERGIEWHVIYPEDDRNNLLVSADHDDRRLLSFLQERGAVVERNVERTEYTHYTLRVPGVASDVTVLVARACANEFALTSA